MTYKIHFTYGTNKVRCGRRFWRSRTIHAKQVTCKACLSLMKGTVG